jgi:hypothetical protein
MHRTAATFSRQFAAALLAAGFAIPLAASSAAGDALLPPSPCPDGVTVVVDFTDVGGRLETGCATDPATGVEALQQAGFTDTRDPAGMICAIDARPDPCPETFAGSYWSYWYGGTDGTWQVWMEGADTAVPAAGGFEGWRYNDGSTGPSELPLDLRAPPAGASAAVSGDDGTDAGNPVPEAAQPWVFAVVGIGAIGAVVAVGVGVIRRSGRGSSNGPTGQD